MSTLEQDISQAMAAFADGAPDDMGLLSRVQAGSRRRTRTRRILASLALGATAALVAIIALGPVSIPRAESRYADPTGFLVDSRDLEVRFPLAPSFLPPGLDPDQVLLTSTEHYGEAQYRFGDHPQHQVVLSWADTARPQVGTATTVGGRPATETCDPDTNQCRLWWERTPRQFVTVVVVPDFDGARRLAHEIAEGLTDRPIVHRPKLVLGLAPARGCVLNDPQPTATSMNPVGVDGSSCPVSAEIFEPGAAATAGYPDASGQSVRLGGYDGWLQERTEFLGGTVGANRGLAAPSRATPQQMWLAVLKLDGGGHLAVQTPRTGGWSRDALDRFVRAIILPTS